MSAATRLALQAWLSPGFPVGGFAYSQGLESAQAFGEIPDGAALESWLHVLLDEGAWRNDALLLAEAWRAAVTGDVDALRNANALAVALAAGAERRLESTSQGRAFVRALTSSWPAPAWGRLCGAFEGAPVSYPVAVGTASAAHGLELAATIEAFLLASAGAALSAAARLGIVGQTEAQSILARLAARLPNAASIAIRSGPDDLGSSTLRSEILYFLHETQYSRLFRA